MDTIVPIIISVVALFATLYQSHLQRVHNQKSVKPLGQIDLMDRARLLYIHVQNNGVGPLIVERLTFLKENEEYSRIQDCLDIDPTSYDHIDITPTNNKVVIPSGFLDVFSKQFSDDDNDKNIRFFRQQLSMLHLKVEGRDIYNNKVVVEKNLQWFSRYEDNLITLKS